MVHNYVHIIETYLFQHFFGQYSTKTKARLEKFDREFSEKLQETEAKVMLIMRPCYEY